MTTTLPENHSHASVERATLHVDFEAGEAYIDAVASLTPLEWRQQTDKALESGVFFDLWDDELYDTAPDGRERIWGIFIEEVVPDWAPTE